MSAEAPSELIERETTAHRETVPAPDPDWPPDVQTVYKKLRGHLFDEEVVIQDALDDWGLGNHDTCNRFRIETGHHEIKLLNLLCSIQILEIRFRNPSLHIFQ